jgi:hypothetical protein
MNLPPRVNDAARGPRPPRSALRLGLYLRRDLPGPRGIGAALVLPFANAEMMNLHLTEISSPAGT